MILDLLIPTTTVLKTEESKLLGESHTLAFVDDEVWYLIRLGDGAQIRFVKEAYPEFENVNFPGGSLTPAKFANKISRVAKAKGLTVKVMDEAAIKRARLGGLLGVNRGSTHPPRFVELTHNWGTENDENFSHHDGNSDPRGFGHIGITVPDVYEACSRFESQGVEFQKKPDDGNMKGLAFIKDPDG